MVAVLLLSSCDEGERHKVLTFFFDGVPPLRQEVSETAAVPKEEKAAPSTPATNWHIHEPVKDCTRCHGNQPRRGASAKVQLVAQVPQLCYQCHPGPATLTGWVHGPVATGDCLLCHEPHRTKTEALLRKPLPELCFQCHEVQAVHAIAGHAEPSYGHCVDCHEGHAGTARSLLKATAGPSRN